MFKFLRRKKTTPAFGDRVALILGKQLRRLQEKWAAFMNAKMNALPVHWKKRVVIGFTALSAVVCIRILVVTFTGNTALLQTGSLHWNGQAVATGEGIAPVRPEASYRTVRAFHRYMDSLTTTATGKKIRDSMLQLRPGLLDSILLLEKLYHKNK